MVMSMTIYTLPFGVALGSFVAASVYMLLRAKAPKTGTIILFGVLFGLVMFAMCKAALRGASLNVYINTGMMKDRDRAEKLDKEAEEILLKYSLMADHVFDIVLSKIRKD